ncbi:MAG: hypothetical protein SGI89_15610 [bacterium]|nr:hypothetical protein [bacterium]
MAHPMEDHRESLLKGKATVVDVTEIFYPGKIASESQKLDRVSTL